MSPPGQGLLVLVATPIGNLGDLSPRAVRTMAEADLVLCEDTRRTGRLLAGAGVKAKRLLAVHAHNEAAQIDAVLEWLRAGDTVAMVSDAGLPGISDPGARLVRAAVEHGLRVGVVPGPSAVLAALVVSGLSTDRFVFEGFLPRRGQERDRRLGELSTQARTMVLYEAPHRLAKTMSDLAVALGGTRRVALVRELTKLHEEVWRGSLDEAVARCATVPPRGEHVVVLEGSSPPLPPDDAEISAALASRLAAGASTRDAVADVVTAHGVSRRRAYELAVPLRDLTSNV